MAGLTAAFTVGKPAIFPAGVQTKPGLSVLSGLDNASGCVILEV
jgi:hypothetical protein